MCVHHDGQLWLVLYMPYILLPGPAAGASIIRFHPIHCWLLLTTYMHDISDRMKINLLIYIMLSDYITDTLNAFTQIQLRYDVKMILIYV